MPITPLPTPTILILGSTLTLTDSSSVVKELLDNALDALASSISLEISSNTLDIIQLTDNGHGIPPTDRPFLCQRYCTSKIRDLQQLAELGGKSLGFRGEALASVVEMSGDVVLTTRVEGEVVGVGMRMRGGGVGGVGSQQPVAHPIGTTVRVMDFLKHLPVRKQTALKTAPKVLARIKSVMQAYALARPKVRFSMKVMKAKNEKCNWLYAPVGGGSVAGAALKVVGQAAVAQCRWFSWSSAMERREIELEPQEGGAQGDGYVVEGLLPRPGCDLTVLNSCGQYLSIDSRPVSCHQGTLKQVVVLYKKYLRSASTVTTSIDVVNPFFCINVVCPTGSYDVNVEPAKDDVLFKDPERFLEVVESFFKSVYGQLNSCSNMSGNHESLLDPKDCSRIGIDRLTHSKYRQTLPRAIVNFEDTAKSSCPQDHFGEGNSELPASPSIMGSTLDVESAMSVPDYELHEEQPRGNASQPPDTDRISQCHGRERRDWATSVNNAFDETDEQELVLPSDHIVADEEDALGLKDASISNPWTLAKMNVSLTPKRSGPSLDRAEYGLQLLTPGHPGPKQPSGQQLRSTDIRTLHSSVTALATPGPSSPFKSASDIVSSSPVGTSLPLNSGTHRQRLFHSSRSTETLDSTPGHSAPIGNSPGLRKPSIDFVPARTLQIGTPLDAIPDISQKPGTTGPRSKQKQAFVNKPFIPPMTHSEQSWPQAGTRQQAKSTWEKSTGLPLPMVKQGLNKSPRAMDPDLAFTMDYERRKQLATQNRSKMLRQQTLEEASTIAVAHPPSSSAARNSPHANRYAQAVAALSPQTSPTKPQLPILGADDPRGYLVRLQTLEAAETKNGSGQLPRLKRRRTANLPLESVPAEDMLQELKTTIKTAEPKVRNRVRLLAQYDEYIKPQEVEEEDLRAETKRWEEALRRLLKGRYRDQEKYIDGVAIDLIAILQQ